MDNQNLEELLQLHENEVSKIDKMLSSDLFDEYKQELTLLKNKTLTNIFNIKYFMYIKNQENRSSLLPEEICKIFNENVNVTKTHLRRGFFNMHKVAHKQGVSLKELYKSFD